MIYGVKKLRKGFHFLTIPTNSVPSLVVQIPLYDALLTGVETVGTVGGIAGVAACIRLLDVPFEHLNSRRKKLPVNFEERYKILVGE